MPKGPKPKTCEERFWPKVDKGPHPKDCWMWKGAKTKPKATEGYGIFSVIPKASGSKNKGAHKYSWELANGRPVPAGRWVLHSCDNPLCVNPEHLSLGTPKQNSEEMCARGRVKCGDKHYSRTNPEILKRGSSHFNSRLTETQVRQIRYLRNTFKVSHAKTGAIYSVSGRTAADCIDKLWLHVKTEASPEEKSEAINRLKAMFSSIDIYGLP